MIQPHLHIMKEPTVQSIRNKWYHYQKNYEGIVFLPEILKITRITIPAIVSYFKIFVLLSPRTRKNHKISLCRRCMFEAYRAAGLQLLFTWKKKVKFSIINAFWAPLLRCLFEKNAKQAPNRSSRKGAEKVRRLRSFRPAVQSIRNYSYCIIFSKLSYLNITRFPSPSQDFMSGAFCLHNLKNQKWGIWSIGRGGDPTRTNLTEKIPFS